MLGTLQHIRLLTLTALMASSPALAQGQPPERPVPAPEMAGLAFFIGTFACGGKAHATPMSTAHPMERTITGQIDLDGHWLFMRFLDKTTKDNPTPIRGNWQLTYDAKAKGYVAVWTDNLGRWFPQTSAGWNGNIISFAGDFLLNEQKATVRDTFTKKSDSEMLMAVDLQKGGEWTRFIDLNCRRE
jgi:Protein of unknown function (DUF1579)